MWPGSCVPLWPHPLPYRPSAGLSYPAQALFLKLPRPLWPHSLSTPRSFRLEQLCCSSSKSFSVTSLLSDRSQPQGTFPQKTYLVLHSMLSHQLFFPLHSTHFSASFLVYCYCLSAPLECKLYRSRDHYSSIPLIHSLITRRDSNTWHIVNIGWMNVL